MIVTILLLILILTDNYISSSSLDAEMVERERDKQMMQWNGADDRRQWPPRMKRTIVDHDLASRTDSLFDAIK